MTTQEKALELMRLLKDPSSNKNGGDSIKRKLAIELLAGEADGEQTDRLARIALVISQKGWRFLL